MLRATLSSKFQLSIPKSMCDDLQLQVGQQFTILARGNIIELIPVRSVQETRGILSSCEYQNTQEYRDRQDSGN